MNAGSATFYLDNSAGAGALRGRAPRACSSCYFLYHQYLPGHFILPLVRQALLPLPYPVSQRASL